MNIFLKFQILHHLNLFSSSITGHSTDAIIYLKVLSSQAEEYLPVYNKSSSKHYRQSGNVSHHDWSSNPYNNPKQKPPLKSHFVN